MDPEEIQAAVNVAAAAAAAALAGDLDRQDMGPAILSLLDSGLPYFAGTKGEDAVAHFLKFEDYLRDVLDATPDEAPIHQPPGQIQKFKKSLTGKARKWFGGIVLPNTLVEMRTAFHNKYSRDPTRTEDLMIMTQAKMMPNETVEEFGERISESMARLTCANDMIRDFFLMGLPHEMSMWIRNRQPETFENAFAAAKEYSKLNKVAAPTMNTGMNVQFNVQEDNKVEELLQEVRELKYLAIQKEIQKEKEKPAYRNFRDNNDKEKTNAPNKSVRFEEENPYPPRNDRRGFSPDRRGFIQSTPNRRGFSPDRREFTPFPSNRRGFSPDRRGYSPDRRWNSDNRPPWSQNRPPWSQNGQARSPTRNGYDNRWNGNDGRWNGNDSRWNGYDTQGQIWPDQERNWENRGRNWNQPPREWNNDFQNRGPRGPMAPSPRDWAPERNRGRSPERREQSSPKSPDTPKNGERPAPGTCWNCNKTGHFYRNCPTGKQDSTYQQKSQQSAMRAFIKDVDEIND